MPKFSDAKSYKSYLEPKSPGKKTVVVPRCTLWRKTKQNNADGRDGVSSADSVERVNFQGTLDVNTSDELSNPGVTSNRLTSKNDAVLSSIQGIALRNDLTDSSLFSTDPLHEEHGPEPLDPMDGIPEEAFLSNSSIGIDVPLEAEEPLTSDSFKNRDILYMDEEKESSCVNDYNSELDSGAEEASNDGYLSDFTFNCDEESNGLGEGGDARNFEKDFSFHMSNEKYKSLLSVWEIFVMVVVYSIRYSLPYVVL
ncbi:uncharacterized protein LOC124172843 isoform X2 [Ischnura elegans]|uniref:uncharacterized protein LOC124172843 isoform X2 n=1 Tax=Ischnura elegans TaxID=197161 RepID=UPI001ED88773|nr:uncharacterized protein LOC124172843 isoform X2 [Ischnura elegans]